MNITYDHRDVTINRSDVTPESCNQDIAPEIEDVYVPNLIDRSPPLTAHVLIKLSTDRDSDYYEVKALHDSGCAKTLIHLKTFQQIPNYNLIPITELPHIRISSCTGERSNIIGLASLTLTFRGDNGNKISFPHDVFIHDSLEHDFLLGRDFTGTPIKIMETNQHIYLSDKPELNSIENLSTNSILM